MQLVGIVPTDASILQRLGEMYDNEGDKSQAFQYHYDVSHDFISSEKNTISGVSKNKCPGALDFDSGQHMIILISPGGIIIYALISMIKN